MKGVYSEIQEIECLCFDYGMRKISISQYHSLPQKPLSTQSHKARNQTFYETLNDSKNKTKQSLKRKHLSEVFQSPSIKNQKAHHTKNASLHVGNFFTHFKDPKPNQKYTKMKENNGTFSQENLRLKMEKNNSFQNLFQNGHKMIRQTQKMLWQKKEKSFLPQNNQKSSANYFQTKEKVNKLKKASMNGKKFQQDNYRDGKRRISMGRNNVGLRQSQNLYEEKECFQRETAETWNNPSNKKQDREVSTPQTKIYLKQIESFEESNISRDQSVVVDGAHYNLGAESSKRIAKNFLINLNMIDGQKTKYGR